MGMLTKSQSMADIAAGRTREAFHHAVHGIFDIAAMRGAALEQGKVAKTAKISDDLIAWLFDKRKIDDQRLKELNMPQIKSPCICIEYADESDLLIDGCHRIIAGYLRYGIDTFTYYKFTEREIIRPVNTGIVTSKPVWGKFDILPNGDIEMFPEE